MTKIANEGSCAHGIVNLEGFERHGVQRVTSSTGLDTQAFNASQGTIHKQRQFVSFAASAISPQTPLGFFRCEPGGLAIRFLGGDKLCDLAKMSRERKVSGVALAVSPCVGAEGDLFDAAVDTGFLDGLKRGRLRVRQAGLDAALGKDPAASTGLDQQKLDTLISFAIADSGDLLASRAFAQTARLEGFRG